MSILFLCDWGMIRNDEGEGYKTTVYTRLITGLCTVWVGNLGEGNVKFVYNFA